MTMLLQVFGLAGSVCDVEFDVSSDEGPRGCDAKATIEYMTKIPAREQLLWVDTAHQGPGLINDAACGTENSVESRGLNLPMRKLLDNEHLLKFVTQSGDRSHEERMVLSLTLVRRPPEVALAEEVAEWLPMVRQDSRCLADAPPTVRADRSVVLAAVRQRGWPLRYASVELRQDREVVLEAVGVSGHALKYAPLLTADREVVSVAVATHPEALRYASEDLRADRQFILDLVQQHGLALEYVSETLKADPEIVSAAVRQDSRSFMYAHEDLQASPSIAELAGLAGGVLLSSWFQPAVKL